MKKQLKVLSLSLLSTLVISSSAYAGSGEHHHEHPTDALQYIGDSLPKAADFKDLEEEAIVERDTSVSILNEKGTVTGIMKTDKNTQDGKASPQDTGARKVTVLAVADEEYRSAYSDWQTRIQNIIETADNAFNRDHGVDFVVQAVANWSSQGSNSSQILSDLQRDWDGRGYDFVAGFTRDSAFDAGGIAYVYQAAPSGSAISVNLDQGTANTAKAAQHEFSHNFGLGHDAQGSGIRCIMNYDYSYSIDYWHSQHNSQIAANKYWFGN
jgi:predicted Zn-dependent protease